MKPHGQIRKKILYATLALTVVLLLLMNASLTGVYAYRGLTHSVGQLAAELKLALKLRSEIDTLLQFGHRLRQPAMREAWQMSENLTQQRDLFRQQLTLVTQQLSAYDQGLATPTDSDPLLSEREAEHSHAQQIQKKLGKLQWICSSKHSEETAVTTSWLNDELVELNQLVQELPQFTLERMEKLRGEVRSSYRSIIGFILACSAAALLIVTGLFVYFRHNVVQPFKVLLNGCNQIADGDFEHRIRLNSSDEMSLLANTLNDMTDRFVEVRDNLNEKVKQRTREVVRSEQLASVGFLAAGVAHEINNPLASIAWSAEALESRLHEILHQTCDDTLEPSAAKYDEEQVHVLRKYLKCIQDEAFRVKGITERLLDFSRLGESQRRQNTDIPQSVADVVALVKHLGQYRNKKIDFKTQLTELNAFVSPTEFKQVVLNLLTNSLDASSDGETVVLELVASDSSLSLIVSDTGCGMTEEVLAHLFEPFFTRRRDGRGTGLGLSISYRIVQDHGGSLIPSSPGPGKGSRFVLTLPLNSTSQEKHERYYAVA
ncbi:MAG: HAMP domain-containing protein [Planctomycetales bacterium]|nr:HAMP domain-containing protein [Planctomycetales bacterium]